MTINKLFIIITILPFVKPIWPPSYSIKLNHEESFVISEVMSSDDIDDTFERENEMIQEEELKKFDLKKDSGKYSQLHQLSIRHNQRRPNNERTYKRKLRKKLKEVPYVEEAQPWEGGMVDKNGKLKLDSKVTYYNHMKSHGKREELGKNQTSKTLNTTNNNNNSNNNTAVDYDYNILKVQYDQKLEKARKSKKYSNYTETKDEETVKEAVEVIVNAAKVSSNCSEEQKEGIGLTAAKCILGDLTKQKLNEKERKAIFKRISNIILIWLLVYILVAIPCWCQRGWCCCCFQCKFCKPRERIDEAKKFLLENPLGVYHTPGYKRVTYKPTNYEKYAQKKLEKALMKL